MSLTDDLLDRNAGFVADGFVAGLRMMPTLRAIVIGCVDPRVDPEAVLGLAPGEVAVIRNVGGRVTPDVLDQLALLVEVVRAAGGGSGPGLELVVLQHTDCGITRLGEVPGRLASFLGVPESELDLRHVDDPRAAVVADLAVLAADPRTAKASTSGLVYDVATGRVDPP